MGGGGGTPASGPISFAGVTPTSGPRFLFQPLASDPFWGITQLGAATPGQDWSPARFPTRGLFGLFSFVCSDSSPQYNVTVKTD